MARVAAIGPAFEAQTKIGCMHISAFAKDKQIGIFSYPADFAPGCIANMSGFALRKNEFTELNTSLLELSTDSTPSHPGWLNHAREKTDACFNVSIISYVAMKVPKLHGMLAPNENQTAAARAVFFIGSIKKIGSSTHYFLNVGGNIGDILQALVALQVFDKFKLALSPNHKRGNKAIASPPKIR